MSHRAARTIKKVHFIEFNGKFNTLGTIEVLFPKYGTPLLAALLRDKGYEVTLFLEGTSDMRLERMADCDLVCFPVYMPILTKVHACAKAIRELRPDMPIIMGGPHVCFYPEHVVDHCDVAVRCEADEVLPQLIERLEHGRDFEGIGGISYRHNGEMVDVPDPPPPPVPDTIPDLTLIDGAERVLNSVANRMRVVNLLQTSRGCTFRCKFCPTLKLFQGKYRNRDLDAVIADIKKRSKINPLFFVVDNDFCCNKKKTRALLERLIDEDLHVFLTVFERHEIGKDREMLSLMRRAGVEVMIVGVESLADETLGVYNKRQSRTDVIRSLQAIRDAGIHVLATFVLGSDADTPARADELIGFMKETQLDLNLFIIGDIENDPSKELIIPLNRRFRTYWQRDYPGETSFWDYAGGNFAPYFPKRMKPSTLQRTIIRVHDEVYSHGNILRKVFTENPFRSVFGISVGYGNKRINDNIKQVCEEYFYDYLESIEEGLYDDNEVLIEEKLERLEGLPLPPPLTERVDLSSYDTLSSLALAPGVVRLELNGLRRVLARKWRKRQRAWAG